jgi:hypothetical protein
MTGPEHYSEAGRMAAYCAVTVADNDREGDEVSDITRAYIALAQVYATLALAAATADPFDRQREWQEVTR